MSDERFLTSYEALTAGLLAKDEQALEASLRILQSAHNHSRSRVVVFVAELPPHLRLWVLERWFQGAWFLQRAAWWVAASLERSHDEALQELVLYFRLFDRLVVAQDNAVCVQALAWLHARALAGRVPAIPEDSPVTARVLAWVDDEDPALAIAALQGAVSAHIHVPDERARRAIHRGAAVGIREADLLGARYGVIDAAMRLVDEVRSAGPWSTRAVDTLCAVVARDALEQVRALLKNRFLREDVRLNLATILAAHGDERAWETLVSFSASKDSRVAGMGLSARIRALEKRGSERAHFELWKEVLKQPESVRAWVLSQLNALNPTHLAWLEQARKYGTDEERSAVDDAFRSNMTVDETPTSF